jgi:beta-lactamase class A
MLAAVFSVVIGIGLVASYLVITHLRSAAAAAPYVEPTVSSSSSPAPTPKASPTVNETVRAALATQLKSKGQYAAVGVVDRVTGAEVLYNEKASFQTASIMKADILASLLWKLQNENRQLTDDQKALATRMITESDNQAASQLYIQLGEATGLNAANKVFGLTSTTPGPGEAWGKAHTTVADQLALLEVLASDDSPLSAASREYQLGLMSRVDTAQRWGVPAAASKTATGVYVKNGWDTLAADGGLWEINTIGRIVEPGHDWLVVVLSSHNSSMNTGEDVVEGAAKMALEGLRGS